MSRSAGGIAAGAVQLFVPADAVRRDLVLAAVGELQFDVVTARLADEYAVQTSLDRRPYAVARWVIGDPAAVAGIA